MNPVSDIYGLSVMLRCRMFGHPSVIATSPLSVKSVDCSSSVVMELWHLEVPSNFIDMSVMNEQWLTRRSVIFGHTLVIAVRVASEIR